MKSYKTFKKIVIWLFLLPSYTEDCSCDHDHTEPALSVADETCRVGRKCKIYNPFCTWLLLKVQNELFS